MEASDRPHPLAPHGEGGHGEEAGGEGEKDGEIPQEVAGEPARDGDA